MPIAPTAPSAVPEFPALSDRVTYNLKAYNFGTAMRVTFVPEMEALATNVYANAVESATNAAVCSANAAQAVAATGVTLWVSGTNYTAGISYVVSSVDLKTYQRIVSGAGATDPSADATNWRVVAFGLVRTIVTATTQSASDGNDYWLANVAATTVTAPTAIEGAKFRVNPVNGLLTNAIDFGSATVLGYGGNTASGLITMTLGAPMEFEYSTTLGKWVMA